MAKKDSIAENGVNFEDLGITEMEADRVELDVRGAFQITRYRMDSKTKYNKELGGILKIDGYDIATGEPMKYRTTSTVIISAIKEIADKVGCKLQTDSETKIDWYVFVKPVNVSGFEWKKTENGKYLKIVVPLKQ
jgi:hypothetical protein